MTNFENIRTLTLKTSDDGTVKQFGRLPKAKELETAETKAFFDALTNAYKFLDKFATRKEISALGKAKDILRREVFAEIGVSEENVSYYTELSAWAMNPSDKKSGFTTVSASTFKKHVLAFCGLAMRSACVAEHAKKSKSTVAVDISTPEALARYMASTFGFDYDAQLASIKKAQVEAKKVI